MFYDRVSRAFANGECRIIDVIREDALVAGNVSSAKWLLTARYPNWRPAGKGPQRSAETDNSDVDVIEAIEKKLNAMAERKLALAGD
jgi:hypothetical protein